VSVLVISHEQDLHATRVMEALRQRGETAHLIDLGQLPDHATLALDYSDPTSPVATWRSEKGDAVDLTAASAVWWRRPTHPELINITDQDAYGFAHGEWHEALNGLYQLLDSARWMNPPELDARASRKALQLRTASRLGWRVPDTLMTSDPVAAREFVERHGVGSTVYKIFAATYQVWRETRMFTAADLDSLDSLRLAPVIFQEYIPAVADLRVTVVGSALYPMAIYPQDPNGVDFRLTLGQSRTAAYDLPPEVRSRIRVLMDRLGLVYGGVDLRLTPEGDYVFLEVNPAGEFLFCEAGAGFPITEAMAGWLTGPESSSQPSAPRGCGCG
jgi:glutathione synthase/RimK-type ligase-like ATP-grasp enzyme